MSTTLPTSLSDFTSAVECLEANGSNWVIFQHQFTIAVQQKKVWSQFDGTSPKPSESPATSTAATEHAKKVSDWNERETLAKYLLTQKLPDSIFTKYLRKNTVAEIWSALVTEFTKKSMIMKSNLHSEFMALRYQKGADLRLEFDRVRGKYEALMNAGVTVSPDDYRTLIINFVPSGISSFIAQVSANMKMLAMMSSKGTTGSSSESSDEKSSDPYALEPEQLMQAALEEWDRRGAEIRARGRNPNAVKDSDVGAAMVTVSSERPGATAGGAGRKRFRGRRPVGACWNCGERGHRRDECPSAKNKSSSETKDSRGNAPSSGSQQNSKPSTTRTANVAAIRESVDGVWSAFVLDDDVIGPMNYDAIREVAEEAVAEESDPDADAESDDSITLISVSDFGSDWSDGGEEVPDDAAIDDAIELPIPVSAAVTASPTSGEAACKWDLYDSGASHHMSPCREDFVDFKDIPPFSLTAANNEAFMAYGIGDVFVTLPSGDKTRRIRLTKVLYTPAIGFTLISIGRMDAMGYSATFGRGLCVIRHSDGWILGSVPRDGFIYRVPHCGAVSAGSGGVANAAVQRLSLRALHIRMGHISPAACLDLVKRGAITGIELTNKNVDFQCIACIKGKSTEEDTPKERLSERRQNFGDEIHSDLWGPGELETLGKRKYWVGFTDDWSRWTTVYLLRVKSDVFPAYTAFASWVRTHMGVTIKCLHTDRGGEYMSLEFGKYLEKHGTERRLTVHDTPAQNGVSERLNRTLIERVRAMMYTAQLPLYLWGEALCHAVYLKNRCWTSALPVGMTPYEMINGEQPSLDILPVWGCVVWVHDKSGGKLSMRAKEGRWVGFDTESRGHRIYWPSKGSITVERSVTFEQPPTPVDDDFVVVPGPADESRGSIGTSGLTGDDDEEDNNDADAPKLQGESGQSEEEDEVLQNLVDGPFDPPTIVDPPVPPAPETDHNNLPILIPEPRRSGRQRQPSQYLRDIMSGKFVTGSRERVPQGLQMPGQLEVEPEMEEEMNGAALAAVMSEAEGLDPRSLAEARRRPDWPRWQEAMEEEHDALVAHGTWELEDKPAGVNVVGCRWVFHLKRDAAGNIIRYKARLVAQGFSQVPGVDFFDTYAPVAKMAAIRTSLAIAAERDYEIHQVDVKNAYLNGEFEEGEVIYMKLPPGLNLTSRPNQVLRLLRPLYGLKQSARHWYTRLTGALSDHLGMARCDVDQAVFYRRSGTEQITICAHVDDLTIMTSSVELMEEVKTGLKKEFKISDMGEIHWILGFAVKRDRENRTISLSQASYIRSILQRYGFDVLKPVSNPMNPNAKLSSADAPKTAQDFAFMSTKPYRETVGSANYASLGTRFDLTHVVGILSRYLENPGPAHWGAVKWAFAYLNGSVDLELTYGREVQELTGYTDADGSVNEDRKAISGYAFLINGGAVSWSSKKQEIISLSTTEAEYVAATHATKEALWLRNFIGQVFGDVLDPTTLYCDNQSAIALAKDHQYHARTKHIDIRFHFVRWAIDEGKLKMTYCPTGEMLADAFTKALPSTKVKHFASAMGLVRA